MHVSCSDANELRERVDLLRIERDLAFAVGLDADRAYMADLELELEALQAAWVGAAVTEIAVARADAGIRPQG